MKTKVLPLYREWMVMDNVKFEIAFVILNLSSVFLLFFIYIKYIEMKAKKISNKVFIAIVATVSIILCMTFPLHGPNGELYDMRVIPLFIGTIYGGRRVGLVLLSVILSFRLLISYDNYFIVLIQYSVFYGILLFLVPLFSRPNEIKRKTHVAVAILFFPMIFFISVLALGLVTFSPFYLVLITIIHILPMLTVPMFISFIENTRNENLLISELKKIEKLKSVSEIAASISHEVRNPLTVVRGFLQLMKDRSISDDSRNMYIELSLKEVDRAECVISDYLTFAKPSIENIEIIDLAKEIVYVGNVVQPYAAMYNIEIAIKTVENIFIAGELQRLHQCLINLVKNGIEAMSNGGKLFIEMIDNRLDVTILVGDTGIGMTKDQLARLGTPYYSTKGSKGTGLGTMVVFSVVKAMNGKVEVESNLGLGTEFKLSFPKIHSNI